MNPKIFIKLFIKLLFCISKKNKIYIKNNHLIMWYVCGIINETRISNILNFFFDFFQI